MVQNLFQELQIVYQNIFISLLDELDEWLMNNRDYKRFKNREMQKCTIATMFGEVTINRSKYFDREAGHRVATNQPAKLITKKSRKSFRPLRSCPHRRQGSR
ncbi:UPF0236 family transposase-like protein [Amphibacillus xylanus]|uniref:Uncharacterized protein n=1 Tax=Amphibacillus xylanus (strain ATCC 51415 / DSM 6626 / JCM 7361 / LMG 17667 / NBRC 15112 / Ep01) TaxID=698758 RepID=K0J6D8_AMPXN|nr:UPF0236 family protein [Amphibacillus xylanus]BAM46603.1 hypothetical protein AXY_04710 [Amphibacillus xylanus NBRC 15112]